MSVDAFTVDGKVTLDTKSFNAEIKKVTTKLEQLTAIFNQPVDTASFVNSFRGIKAEFDSLKGVAKEIKSLFRSITDIPKLVEDMAKVKAEVQSLKEKWSTVKSETTAVNNEVKKMAENSARVKAEISAITSSTEPLTQMWATMNGQLIEHYDILAYQKSEIGQLNAKWRETQQVVKQNTQFVKEMSTTMNMFNGANRNVTNYFLHEQELLQTSLQLIQQKARAEKTFGSEITRSFSALMKLGDELERQVMTTQKRATALSKVGKQIIKNGNELKRNLTYEEEMVATNNLIQNGIGKTIAEKYRLNVETKVTNELETSIVNLLTEEEGIIARLTGQKQKTLNALKEELNLEKEILNVEKQQSAEETKQTSEKMTGAKMNQLDKGGYLGRRIGSMAVTMLGYQELMDVWEKTTTNINAKGSYAHFGKQLQTDERYLKQTGQTTGQVAKSLTNLDGQLRNLQKDYRKIDMKTVGANAEETAFKYGLQADAIGDLSEVMAIYGSEFVKQGRSQEDSILALNDALDGELRRLKEVNVTSDELKEHGWKGQGDQIGMIKALKEIAEERGYDVTAKQITNLSDAITYAELQLAFFLSDLFEIAEPSLRSAVMKLATGFEWLADRVAELKEYLKGLPQPVKDFLKESGSNVILGFVGLWIGRKIWGAVKNMSLFGDGWSKLMEKLGRTKGMDKATESMGKMGQTTGGTAPTGGGNWKDGVKNWGKNLAKNLGKMAEVFIEVAVAIAMAWALLKESMILIGDLGKDWEAHKSEIDKGMDFIKTYGIWILAISGVMAIALDYFTKADIGRDDYVNMAKTGLKVAEGIAISMGLIAEAIGLLVLPLGAIAFVGGTVNFLGDNFTKGMETLRLIGDALHTITSDDTLMTIILAFGVLSVIFGASGSTVGWAMAVGIATSLALLTEAIGLLILPLGAIALLGGTASMLGEDSINQGVETIKMIGRVLKVLSEAMTDLVIVDLGVLADRVLNFATQLMNGGKDAMTTLTEDIFPSLRDFIIDFNAMDFSVTIDSAKAQAITNMANQIPPMFKAVQNLTNALGGGDVSISFMGVKIEAKSGLGDKLDNLYEDIKEVMTFANKLGGLSTANGGANANAITQTANAIGQLKVKLNLLITTISSASSRVQSASQRLGNALPTGFKTGSASFNSTVVSTLAKGISAVQSRYGTWLSGGKASAQKLTDGFKTIGNKLTSTIRTEMGYALRTLDGYKDDFYNKGKSLGLELTRGYQDGADIHSPGLIARTTARELRYTMDALTVGERMMYQGGVALGQALTNGYNSYGNLRTDVGVLASKGVSNEQLQANAKNTQLNGNLKGQNPQLTQTNINIDMSNSTVIGVQDLDNKIRQAVEKAIVSMNSPNGAIGY